MGEPARYTLKEVAQRDGLDGKKTWIVIHDLVYDVTGYKSGHPGGPELIDEYAGQDATSGFDDFGHSSDAKRMLKDFLIGELVDEDKRGKNKKKKKGKKETIESCKMETKRSNPRKRMFLSTLCGACVT